MPARRNYRKCLWSKESPFGDCELVPREITSVIKAFEPEDGPMPHKPVLGDAQRVIAGKEQYALAMPAFSHVAPHRPLHATRADMRIALMAQVVECRDYSLAQLFGQAWLFHLIVGPYRDRTSNAYKPWRGLDIPLPTKHTTF